MSLFLLTWYCFGWSALAIRCKRHYTLNLCDFLTMMAFGCISHAFQLTQWMSETINFCPIIWRRHN